MKKLFFIALMSLIVFSCTKDDGGNGPAKDANYMVKVSAVAVDENNAPEIKRIKDALKAIGCDDKGRIHVAGTDTETQIKVKVSVACNSVSSSLTKGFYIINIVALNDESGSKKVVYKTIVGKKLSDSSIHACEFYDNEEVQYATDILTCADEPYNDNGYHGIDKDLNDGAGGDYVYASVKFEEYNPDNKENYITDLILLDSKDELGGDYTIKYNGHTYHMPSTYCDMNQGCDGDHLYLMYTKEPIDGKYLINQAETGYVYHYGTRWYGPDETSNTTRLIYTYWGDDFDVKSQNYGSYDRVVPLIGTDGTKKNEQGDFNATAGGEFMYLVGAYDTAPTAPYYKWMSAIPDDTRITAMSIPGSHDSYTYNTGYDLGFAKDQMRSTRSQWKAGIRAYDIRLTGNTTGTIAEDIMHGFVHCVDFDGNEIKYSHALNELKDLLNTNPTETAIAFVNFEPNPITEVKITPEFRLMTRNRVKEILGDIAIAFRPDLTMGEARGKVIVMFGDDYKENAQTPEDHTGPIGTTCTNYPDQGTGTCYSVIGNEVKSFDCMLSQNKWEFEYDKMHEKVDLFIKKSDEFDGMSLDYWCKNNTSGYYMNSVADVHSSDFAEHVVPDIYNYIKANKHRLGIVMMDFAGYNLSKQSDVFESHKTMGNALLRAVIENNFR